MSLSHFLVLFWKFNTIQLSEPPLHAKRWETKQKSLGLARHTPRCSSHTLTSGPPWEKDETVPSTSSLLTQKSAKGRRSPWDPPGSPGPPTHVDREVLGGAADVAGGRQCLWDVLQGEAGRVDLHGQPHHQVPLGASERPAIPWVHVRLGKRRHAGA